MYKKGALSILQIVILILGIIAISYAIGSEMRIVSGTSNWYDELIKRGASEVDGGLFTPDGRYLGEGDILKKEQLNGFAVFELKWEYSDLHALDVFKEKNISDFEVIGNIYENPDILQLKAVQPKDE